ncbi:hypothetical protein ONZ45_g14570 [Pleurotus djamor]|nr:hypothetical protein ONZ45_g14570 [Pleurotus djamor]
MPIFTNHEVQKALDKEIAIHRAAISTLSKKRNELSAINMLPNDILSQIFVVYKQSFYFSLPDEPEDDEDAEDEFRSCVIGGAWTNILGICSHWRNILLDTPRFWSTIGLSPECTPLIPLYLDRSKHVPLSVHISMSGDTPTNFHFFWTAVSAILSQSSRLERLYLDFEEENELDAEKFFQGMTDATPFLRSLRIDMQTLGNGFFGPISRLTTLPWGSLSALCVLELGDVLFPPDIPDLPSLDTLIVSCPPADDGLNVEWIVTFLSHTPNIRVVELRRVTCGNPAQSTSPRVRLPALQRLALHAHKLSALKMLESLDLPFRAMQTTFSVWEKFPVHDHGLSRLPALLAGNASTPQDAINMKLIVSSLTLQLRPVDETTQYPKVELHLPHLSRALKVFSQAPLSHVTEFTILQPQAMSSPVVPGDWLRMLHPMNDLQILKFTDCDLSLIRNLAKGITENPSLTEVLFEEVIWIKSHGVKAHDITETLKALRTFCDQRGKDGHAIHRLIFRKCAIMSKTINIVKAFATVDWDGNGLELWQETTSGSGIWELREVESDEPMRESDDEA